MPEGITEPGIYPGLSYLEYDRIPAMRNSVLSKFSRMPPAKARYEMLHPIDSAAFRTGDALHCAILEPERFAAQFVKQPRFDMRTNRGKADYAEWIAEHPTHSPLKADEYDQAIGMRDSVWSHPLASQLLKSVGKNELAIVWRDEKTGILCKARIDRITSHRDWTIVVDVKTTKSASDHSFSGAMEEYGYAQQAGMYLDGLSAIDKRDRRWVFLAVEKAPPYLVRLLEPEDHDIEEGRRRFHAALQTYHECDESGEWPGYAVGLDPINLPPWAYRFIPGGI